MHLMFTDQAGLRGFTPKSTKGIKEKNNDLALVSPAFFLLFARQDCAPVVILEFLLSFFYLSILEIGIISVAPTVMSFSLDCLFLMTFFSLSVQPWWLLLVMLTTHYSYS